MGVLLGKSDNDTTDDELDFEIETLERKNHPEAIRRFVAVFGRLYYDKLVETAEQEVIRLKRVRMMRRRR